MSEQDVYLEVQFLEGSSRLEAQMDQEGIRNDYDELKSKPVINEVPVQGVKTGSDYGLVSTANSITEHEIDKMLYPIKGA